MKIYTKLDNFKATEKTFVTIGSFDGVHVGHQKVLNKLIKSAFKIKADSVLLTFFPHPKKLLQKGNEIKLINTIDERIKLLKNTQINHIIIQPFNKEFSLISAHDFVEEILIKKLNIAGLIIGYDHHFGKNREGNLKHLLAYSESYNFKVEEISKLDIESMAVSSTTIRTAIEQGEIGRANSCLGYHFMLTGTIVRGDNLGEKIGFPTANLFIEEDYKLLPKIGAYIVKSEIDGNIIFGMMNIGYRPTVEGKHQTIEIHYFNFDKNLYGKTIQIDVLTFLRDERKFETVEALKNQLILDKQQSMKYLKQTGIEI